jgi:hypothetical protein
MGSGMVGQLYLLCRYEISTTEGTENTEKFGAGLTAKGAKRKNLTADLHG